jgi:hypothetical protein
MSLSQLGATGSGDAMNGRSGGCQALHHQQRRWPKGLAGARTGLGVVTTIIIVLDNYIVFLVLSGFGCHRSGWTAGRRLPSVLGQSCGHRI